MNYKKYSLVPYENLINYNDENYEKYLKWNSDELLKFKKTLISKGFILTEEVKWTAENHKKNAFNFFNDVIANIYRSTWIGYPHYVIPENIVNKSNFTFELSKNINVKWHKFSHAPINQQPADLDELHSFKVNDDNSLISTMNTETFVGIISNNKYVNYNMEVQLSSDVVGNGYIGIVLAFDVDKEGREHTLTVIRSNNDDEQWALWYNFNKPNQKKIINKSDNINVKKWINNKTLIKIEKKGYDFELLTTQMQNEFNDDEYLYHNKIKFNLLELYDKIEYEFKNANSYGFCQKSQLNAKYEIKYFKPYGKTFETYNKNNGTFLLRGTPYTGRHIIPKLMVKSDINALLLKDENENYIATICPMYRTVLLGYYYGNIVAGGTDMIKSVKNINDVKKILELIYNMEELHQFNIIIDGNIPQYYVNDLYKVYKKINNKNDIIHTWIDLYILTDEFIDRMNKPVTKQYFKMWGYVKNPYQLLHYPTMIDEILLKTSQENDKKIFYTDDIIGNNELNYPFTMSLRKQFNSYNMLLDLLSGNNVKKIKHYKTVKPIPCNMQHINQGEVGSQGNSYIMSKKEKRKLNKDI